MEQQRRLRPRRRRRPRRLQPRRRSAKKAPAKKAPAKKAPAKKAPAKKAAAKKAPAKKAAGQEGAGQEGAGEEGCRPRRRRPRRLPAKKAPAKKAPAKKAPAKKAPAKQPQQPRELRSREGTTSRELRLPAGALGPGGGSDRRPGRARDRRRHRSVMRLNTSAAGRAGAAAVVGQAVADALRGRRRAGSSSRGLHRRLELALVGLERGELASTDRRDVLDVVGLVGLPQQQRVGPVVGEPLLGEEVRVAGGDDAVAGEQAGVAVVGVEPVALPRVVAEHDVGLQPADPVRDLPPLARARSRARRRASRGTRTSPVAPQRAGPPPAARAWRVTTSAAVSASGSQVPFEPSVQTRWWTTHPGRGPLGQRAAAAELDVVGVGADGQRDARASAGRPTSPPAAVTAGWPGSLAAIGSTSFTRGWARSSGMSTSSPSRGSRARPRTPSPRRAASARWRRNEPGP